MSDTTLLTIAVLILGADQIDSKVTPERWHALVYQGSLLQCPTLEDLPKWAQR